MSRVAQVPLLHTRSHVRVSYATTLYNNRNKRGWGSASSPFGCPAIIPILHLGDEYASIGQQILDLAKAIETTSKSNVQEGVVQVPVNIQGVIAKSTDGSRVRIVKWVPQNNLIAAGIWDAVLVWNATTGRVLHRLKGHTNIVASMAVSPDGRIIASKNDDASIQLWDVETGEAINRLVGHTHSVNSIAFSPDGTKIASGSTDNTVRLWDVAQALPIWATRGEHANLVACVAYSPDGRYIASGMYDDTARIWDAQDGTELCRIEGHTGYVQYVAFSPDGQTLATGSYDTTIKFWNVPDWTERSTLQGHTDFVMSIAFSPDSTYLASTGNDMTVRLWNVEQATEEACLTGHKDFGQSVDFSPDGRLLVSASFDRTVRLWNIDVPETAWQPIAQAWKEAAQIEEQERQAYEQQKHEERIRLDREAQEKAEKQAQQQKVWRVMGCCEICGEPLALWQRMQAKTRCPKHKKTSMSAIAGDE